MKSLLSLNVGQRLTLTPQLQQDMHLLQLSTCDLQQEIQNKNQSNPLLELIQTNENDTDYSKTPMKKTMPKVKH